jgi:hypothetical protein
MWKSVAVVYLTHYYRIDEKRAQTKQRSTVVLSAEAGVSVLEN